MHFFAYYSHSADYQRIWEKMVILRHFWRQIKHFRRKKFSQFFRGKDSNLQSVDPKISTITIRPRRRYDYMVMYTSNVPDPSAVGAMRQEWADAYI